MDILQKNTLLKNILEENLDFLAQTEDLAKDLIVKKLSQGQMVLLANPKHKIKPLLIGQPSSIKVNANIGTSPFVNDLKLELEKVEYAKHFGAHTLMDLSTAGNLDEIRKAILEKSSLPVGTVPIYAVAQKYIAKGEDPSQFSWSELLEEIEKQAEQGVSFMTLHCGVSERAVLLAEKEDRVLGIVSRGGSILARWILKNKKENPLLENYGDILKLAKKYNLTLSLGDGMRPGAGDDAGDSAQWEEVITLSELTLEAWKEGVQVMIEGPGHVPLNYIAEQVKVMKRLCHHAPLYVLGPLPTDIAPGYDHIAGAIGGALAALNGADFLCYLTPAEHLTLPSLDDVREGIIASLIAASSAEIALGRRPAQKRNYAISKARKELDWEKIKDLALDREMVCFRRSNFEDKEECAMCGEFCAVKMLR
ncbi:MAG: phosphomethylpyrimidine synthase [Desulfonauticus sp.]|jgi:phosphomethylpyrimidine synthase|nr:phosphomethylpyrimidine synthase [Desulfonauticus sp.]